MFEGQFNDKHKEVELKYNVTINFVVLKDVDENKIDKWFNDMIAALNSGVQINNGIMNQITVERK